MSSFQQNPYSQSFNAESGSRFHQSSSNNNNQHDNAQHSFSGQGAPNNQQGQFYDRQGHEYNQQQHNASGDFTYEDQDSRRLEEKIKGLEERLDSGWYFAYKIFLWYNIVSYGFAGIIGLLGLFGSLLALSAGEVAGFFIILFVFHVSAWAFYNCLAMKNAMNDKNLEEARKASRSMVWYAIYSGIVLAIFRFTYIILVSRKQARNMPGFESVIVEIVIKLYGGNKVLNLLKKREKAIGELNSHCGDYYY